MSAEIDLGLGLLDHQLVDRDGRRCGKVDDLELEGVRDGEPRVVAILTGPPAWRGRGAVGRLLARFARGPLVRVPWDEVAACEAGIHLHKSAHELRLGRGDDRAAKLIERIPGSSL
jgi:sporulation protein YlmC with PRC-barrel domain